MNPVADLLARAVQLGLNIAEDVRDLAGDKFFDVLVRAVVVTTVTNSGLDAKTSNPGADQVIAAGLGAGVGAGWIIGGCFLEAVWIVQFQVAKDFVGADVVQALVMLADGLQDGVGANDVCFDKRPRIA